MAHFAELDETGTVLRVVVLDNTELGASDSLEGESIGVVKLQSLYPGTSWKQTSYNSNFRRRYAGIGFVYSEQHDAFIPPKPFEKFVFDEALLDWVSPVPYPDDGKAYAWSDQKVSWEEVA